MTATDPYVGPMQSSELVSRLAARLRNGAAEPVSQLIVEELWLAVVEGSLEVGARLPTARQLAIDLGVSPRSIQRAFTELERRGVVTTRHGAGTTISLSPPSDEDRTRHQQFAVLCVETVRRAEALGFGPDELIDALSEFRTLERDHSSQETER